MTPQDFSPEELDRLRQLAKRAADDQQWAASLEDPGDRGDLARDLNALDNNVRDIAPELTEDMRKDLTGSWIDESDWYESFGRPLDFYTYVVAWRIALQHHGILVRPEPDEPFLTIEEL